MLVELVVGCARCCGCRTGRVCVYMADARCIGVRYRFDAIAGATMIYLDTGPACLDRGGSVLGDIEDGVCFRRRHNELAALSRRKRRPGFMEREPAGMIDVSLD